MMTSHCKTMNISKFWLNLRQSGMVAQGDQGVIRWQKDMPSDRDLPLVAMADGAVSAIRRGFETRLAGYIAVTFLFLSFVWRPLSL